MRSILVFLFLNFFAISGRAQQKQDSSYTDYLDQFRQFSNTRVLDGYIVQQIVDSFMKNEIVSNDRFVSVTKALYPKGKNIGILLYFYKNNVLRRLFFEPGKLVEDKSIAVSKTDLIQLAGNLGIALRLQQLTANRAPHPRGITTDSSSVALNPYPIIARLTALLLPPVFNESYKHLVIIPCLNIGSIPFQLLRPYGDGSYLVDHCSYTVAPTLIDFAGLRGQVLRTLGSATGSLLDFDDAVAKGIITAPSKVRFTIDRAVMISNPAYPKDSAVVFPDLPGAVREIDSALALLPNSDLLRGADATKERVVRAMNGADLVYFATHGVSDNQFGKDDSYLVLSGSDPYLRTYDVMGLRLRKDFKIPEIVILSACQTGLGATVDAGVAGSIARGFIVGGSKHVVMSLWNVDDAATAYFMNRLLFYLKEASVFRPSEHLRQAALDTKKRYPNPVYWAGFSFFGVDYD